MYSRLSSWLYNMHILCCVDTKMPTPCRFCFLKIICSITTQTANCTSFHLVTKLEGLIFVISVGHTSFYVSLSYMQAPVLAVLENDRLWTGRGWRAVGGGGVGGGLVEAGAEEQRFWGFQMPCLSNISTHFKPVQSQFMKQSTSVYRSPLTSWCLMLAALTYTHTVRQRECVHVKWIHKIFIGLFQSLWDVKILFQLSKKLQKYFL